MVKTRKATKAAAAANAAAKGGKKRPPAKKVNHPPYKLMVCKENGCYTKHICHFCYPIRQHNSFEFLFFKVFWYLYFLC